MSIDRNASIKRLSPLTLALALLIAAPLAAQERVPERAEHRAATSPSLDVPAEAKEAVEVVERFGEALAKADFATVEKLLATEVLILESGGAERSRAEYLGHHAVSDARFLDGADMTLLHRRARVDGSTAWVGTESEVRVEKNGKPHALLSTETMVLANTPEGWRIVHIHWSSRPKKNP